MAQLQFSRGLLAVATGNKSELACGYSTIYGDAVGGYAPIKDLLKTRVWEICPAGVTGPRPQASASAVCKHRGQRGRRRRHRR